MILTIPAAALLVLVACNVFAWPKPRRRNGAPGQPVSVLIPARNEEENIAACLETVLVQDGVFEILVYDDHSSDGTARVVDGFARRDRRVCGVSPDVIPPGWCGKPFACAQLAKRAAGEWLLFLDADVRLAPGAVAIMTGEAAARRATLLSCWPRLEMRGFWEAALMPLLNFVVFTLYPAPLASLRNDASLGLAHGACILARRDAYERVGGHAVVRGEIFEDTRLARRWREAGETSLCLDGQDLVRVRMYDSLAGMWTGFQKNIYPAFRTAGGFAAFLALHAALFLGPFVAGAWAAAACVLGMRVLLAVRFRHPLWSALLHPAAEVFLLALAVSSFVKSRAGGGVEWKGRRYRPA